ncbi:flavin reductase family protein [Helicobacter sp. MIT 21-1697]|uniref:flavin reductase family protein n=1 Tax=Helicobacter sp. MIT 21-1697 TaxID=2993733 RepID=UPI00224B218B|nr:flavin reductase family protein [Helicobacter sp. MIT 21-1697]MCX2716600.1 flavin reductase family protein [Helicobacter sp. MIT 21-1697]
MILDSCTPLQHYKILSNTITPRPIAWISSIFPNGGVNLAPFSFFAPLSVNPPIFSICMMQKSDGLDKDSFKNIHNTRKATISMCDVAHIQALQESSTELEYGVSEANEFHIPLELLQSGYPPAPQGVKVAFMCDLYDVLEIGEDKSVLLEVKFFYIDDSIYSEDLHFLPHFVGRVGRIYKSLGAEIMLNAQNKPKKAPHNTQESPKINQGKQDE